MNKGQCTVGFNFALVLTWSKNDSVGVRRKSFNTITLLKETAVLTSQMCFKLILFQCIDACIFNTT